MGLTLSLGSLVVFAVMAEVALRVLNPARFDWRVMVWHHPVRDLTLAPNFDGTFWDSCQDQRVWSPHSRQQGQAVHPGQASRASHACLSLATRLPLVTSGRPRSPFPSSCSNAGINLFTNPGP